MFGLKELFPKGVSCDYDFNGGKIRLDFRPYTVADAAWMEQEFSEAEIMAIFSAQDATLFFKSVFNQLTTPTQEYITGYIKGDSEGHVKLMEMMPLGEASQKVYDTWLLCRGLTREKLEQLSEEALKKKT